jgi:RTX calcium-binding nonapeptide repeat (4 copies)
VTCSRRGPAALLCGLALALGAIAPAQASSPVNADLAERPAEVRAYWTAARMGAAQPAELRLGADVGVVSAPAVTRTATDASADNTAFPQRVHGKVFFTIEGGSEPGDYVCSATVVTSNSHALAWTAGHCVNDAEFGGGFATNWAFVPGYRNGERPFGTWPAKQLFTTHGWRQNVNVRVDLGAALLARDPSGRGIEDIVGARGIAFDEPREQDYTAFGYPALPTLLHPEFDGERLYSCASPLTGADNPPGGGPAPLEIECDMTGGSSGGGWVIAGGRVASVTSYGYAGDLFHLYGPYQSTAASELYTEASGPPLLCAGVAVTNLGGAAADAFTGSDAGDAFRLVGGPDRAAGAAGDDRACGGGGGDRLAGADGDDVLRGGGGRDVLVGGPGHDVCDGGAGHDRTRSCEERKRVP